MALARAAGVKGAAVVGLADADAAGGGTNGSGGACAAASGGRVDMTSNAIRANDNECARCDMGAPSSLERGEPAVRAVNGATRPLLTLALTPKVCDYITLER
jgi:hypothetical protein